MIMAICPGRHRHLRDHVILSIDAMERSS